MSEIDTSADAVAAVVAELHKPGGHRQCGECSRDWECDEAASLIESLAADRDAENARLERERDDARRAADRAEMALGEAQETMEGLNTALRYKNEDLHKLRADITGFHLDATRYRWLRERDIDAVYQGGVFVGETPKNVVLNLEDADAAIDAAMASERAHTALAKAEA